MGRADGLGGTFGSLALAPLLLYFGAFCWTIGYDTIYAMQDARDDAIVGIRSTARLFAGHTGSASALFYALAAGLALAAILLVGGGAIALIGWFAYGAHLGWQLSKVEGADAADRPQPVPLQPRRRASCCSPASRRKAGPGRGLALSIDLPRKPWRVRSRRETLGIRPFSRLHSFNVRGIARRRGEARRWNFRTRVASRPIE